LWLTHGIRRKAVAVVVAVVLIVLFVIAIAVGVVVVVDDVDTDVDVDVDAFEDIFSAGAVVAANARSDSRHLVGHAPGKDRPATHNAHAWQTPAPLQKLTTPSTRRQSRLLLQG